MVQAIGDYGNNQEAQLSQGQTAANIDLSYGAKGI